MIDETEAARVRAEKTRLDPPPDGKEWSLGWTVDGRRDPARDMLIAIEQPEGAELGLSFDFDEARPGYVYPAAGPGVREDLVDAAVLKLADLLGVGEGGDVEAAATRVLADAGTIAGGYLLETRNLLRIVITAALLKLNAERHP